LVTAVSQNGTFHGLRYTVAVTKKLTKAACEAAGVGITWDPSVPGLGLRVREGGSRTWIYRWSHRNRKRQVKLGVWPDVSPDEARALAALRRADNLRHSPVAQLRAKRVSELVTYYLANHRTRKKGRRPADDRDARRYAAMIVAAWGNWHTDEVTHLDVTALLSECGGPYAANRLRATVRHVWQLGRQWGFVPTSVPNPAIGTPVNRERPRDTTALGGPELVRLVQAAARYPTLSGSVIVVLVLTGARLGEVLGLRRTDVDLKVGVVVLRDRKDGKSLRLQVSPACLAVLRAVLEAHESSWVFPGKAEGRPLESIRKCWAWCLVEAELPAGTRVHDLRAAAASAVAEAVGVRAAQQVLGHAESRTTLRYVRPGDEERRHGLAALEAVLARSWKVGG
jgi:integrase